MSWASTKFDLQVSPSYHKVQTLNIKPLAKGHFTLDLKGPLTVVHHVVLLFLRETSNKSISKPKKTIQRPTRINKRKQVWVRLMKPKHITKSN